MSKIEELKQARLDTLLEDPSLKFIEFKGAALMSAPRTHGFVPMTSDNFAKLAYARFLGISKNGIEDLGHAVRITAPDRSDLAKFVAFRDKPWNMETLEFDTEQTEWVYATDFVVSDKTDKPWKFLMQLAKGDENLANDYLQAMAPIFMARKPAGVVWFIGSGSNGKSALINALYRVFGRYFSSLTTSAIEDGRDTPRLNGVLGNICRESSESRVEDTERYKAIGTHEPFAVHRFRTQDMVDISPDFHTIFNANNIPVFSDKTKGARRRTLVLPFNNHFRDDPTFEDKTFTPEFLGGLMTLILNATHTIRANGYRYKWSDATIQAKDSYDSDVNSVEAYLNYLDDSGVVGFMNYNRLKYSYETWCANNGFVPLGVTTLKRTMLTDAGAERRSVRVEGKVEHRYIFSTVNNEELVWIDNGYAVRKEKIPDLLETVPENGKLDDAW